MFRPLLMAYLRDLEELMEKWQDEASDAALEGNPYKAQYIEQHWCARLK